MDHICLTHETLNINEAQRLVACSSTGATSVFVGTTRDNFDGKSVVSLEYEAYVPMAEKELKKICNKIREKWPVRHICIYHRLGVVPLCEASVIIAVSSVHRRESLEAVQFFIDSLKASVPIWKKEMYAEGDVTWKENEECGWNCHEQPK